MHQTTSELRLLQSRIRGGDHSAIDQFRQQFLPALKRIAQRAMRATCDDSPLTRAIRNLAAQFDAAPSRSSGLHPQQGDDRLACRLCDLLIDRFESMSSPNKAAMQTFKGRTTTLTPV